ncbi:alpha/beta hydrolase [Frondihabitans cladoniiphilus]
MQQGFRRVASDIDAYWSGGGHDSWVARAVAQAAVWGRLHEWAASERQTLARYADDVESIARRAERQKAIRADAVVILAQASLVGVGGGLGAAGLGDWLVDKAESARDPRADDARDASLAAERALAALALERKEADARAVAALRAVRETFHGVRRPSMPHGIDTDDLAVLSPVQLLVTLAALSPTDLRRVAAAAPDLADLVRQADPAVVVGWWASLDDRQRASFVRDAPNLVGTLEGVDYANRDRANRNVLAASRQRLEGERAMLREHREWLVAHSTGHSVMESPDWLATEARLVTVASALAAVSSVEKTLTKGTKTRPRQLVSLTDLETHPKAAVAIGDLDSADHVTFVVPGMGTTVAGSLGAYSRGAENLATQQATILQSRGVHESVATVAWLGYEAPGESDVGGVLGNDLASKGGHRLSGSLGGMKARRGWPANGSPISVVGHSYGSIAAAYAATETGMGSLVLLGSAGMPPAISRAGGLRVPDGRVFASLSWRDGWAPIGQKFGLRRAPTDPLFGAQVFSSGAGVVDGQAYPGVTKHGPLIHHGEGDGFSYLDKGTYSLYNTAIASLSLPPQEIDR